MERQSPPTTKTDPINTPVDVHPNKECPVDEVEELNDDGREIGRWTSFGISSRDWLTRRSIDGDSIIDVITSAAVLPVLVALSVYAVWVAVMAIAHAPIWLWVLTMPVTGAVAVIAFIWTFEKTR